VHFAPRAMAASRAAVCVLGLGNMGSAMARRLRDSNFSLSIWNRSPAKAMALQAEVASAPVYVASAAAAAVAMSDPKAPVLCVLTDTASVISLLRSEGFGASLEGRTFINLASGSPDEGRDIAKVHAEVVGGGTGAAAEAPGGFVDGAYCGPPAKARQGAGQLFLSSDRARLVEEARAVLSTLGSVTFCGAVGAGRAMDYAVVDLFFVNLLSFLSNKAALEREGVDVKQLVVEMKKRLDTVPAVLEAYDARLSDRSEDSYNANTTVSLSTARSYWASRLPYHEARGIPTHLTQLFLDLIDEAAGGKDGPHSGADITRLQEVVRYGSPAQSSGGPAAKKSRR